MIIQFQHAICLGNDKPKGLVHAENRLWKELVNIATGASTELHLDSLLGSDLSDEFLGPGWFITGTLI
jgi:hypothetical protein